MKIIGKLGKDKMIVNPKIWHVDMHTFDGIDEIIADIKKTHNDVAAIVKNNITLVMASEHRKIKGKNNQKAIDSLFSSWRRIKHKDKCMFYKSSTDTILIVPIIPYHTNNGKFYIVNSGGVTEIYSSHFLDRMVERFGYTDRYATVMSIIDHKVTRNADSLVTIKGGMMIKHDDVYMIASMHPEKDYIYYKTVYTGDMLKKDQRDGINNNASMVALIKKLFEIGLAENEVFDVMKNPESFEQYAKKYNVTNYEIQKIQ